MAKLHIHCSDSVLRWTPHLAPSVNRRRCASLPQADFSSVTPSRSGMTMSAPQAGRREARTSDRFDADVRSGAGLGGFPPLLGGNFTRILTGEGASIPRGRIPPFFEGDSGKGMMSRVSQEGHVIRRPIHLAVTRMFWPHLGHSNWNSFIVENGSATRLGRSSSGRGLWWSLSSTVHARPVGREAEGGSAR